MATPYRDPTRTCRKCGGSACTRYDQPALVLQVDERYCHDCYTASEKVDVQIVGSYLRFNHTKAQWNKVHRAADKLKAQGYTINIEHTDGGRRCFARAVVMGYKLL